MRQLGKLDDFAGVMIDGSDYKSHGQYHGSDDVSVGGRSFSRGRSALVRVGWIEIVIPFRRMVKMMLLQKFWNSEVDQSSVVIVDQMSKLKTWLSSLVTDFIDNSSGGCAKQFDRRMFWVWLQQFSGLEFGQMVLEDLLACCLDLQQMESAITLLVAL